MSKKVFFNLRSKLQFRVLSFVVKYAVPAVLTAIFVFIAIAFAPSRTTPPTDYQTYQEMYETMASGRWFDNPSHRDLINVSHSYAALADHANLSVFVFTPLFMIFKSYWTLAVLHGVMCGLLFFIIPRLMKTMFPDREGISVLWVSLFLQALLVLNRTFFHAFLSLTRPETLGLPFVMGAIWAMHAGRWKVVYAMCILMAMMGERGAVGVASLGLYAFFIMGNKKRGVTIAAAASAYFAFAVFAMLPYFNGGNYYHGYRLSTFFDIPLKIKYLCVLWAGFLFLPCVGKKAIAASLCALPLIGLNLVASYKPMYMSWWDGSRIFSFQYQDIISVFFIVASAFGIMRFLEFGFWKKFSFLRRWKWVFLLLLSVSSLWIFYFFDKDNIYDSCIHALHRMRII